MQFDKDIRLTTPHNYTQKNPLKSSDVNRTHFLPKKDKILSINHFNL